MAFGAKILLDSVSPDGIRLTTFEVTFPRFILAEFNTHRMFSRNSASSRAIPLAKTIERIQDDPFVPSYWGKNQKGMQADEELQGDQRDQAKKAWKRALGLATWMAEDLLEAGVHKQLANRILEPFMWHTCIVTATEWDNFFALRAHTNAQPEIQTIAILMKGLYATNTPRSLDYNGWHLPLVRAEERAEVELETLKKVSAGRCARVSYLTHDGRRDLDADLRLFETLRTGGHMSPLEHVARPMTKLEYGEHAFEGNFRGWHQFRKDSPYEDDYSQLR